jgi:hypothetical protein
LYRPDAAPTGLQIEPGTLIAMTIPQRKSTVRGRAPAVGFVSLGCPKALVDSERLITELKSRGYAIAAG